MNEKYLPIGSVVILKNAKKRLMITGYCMTDKNDNANKMYDYSGCLFPEGIISTNQTALFNHEQIEKVFYVGYQDEEVRTFIEKLNNVMKNQDAINANK